MSATHQPHHTHYVHGGLLSNPQTTRHTSHRTQYHLLSWLRVCGKTPLVTCGDTSRPLFPRLVAIDSRRVSFGPLCTALEFWHLPQYQSDLRLVQIIPLELGSRELISDLATTCWLLSCRPCTLIRNPARHVFWSDNAPRVACRPSRHCIWTLCDCQTLS